MTAEERYKVALNILARVGVDGDLIGEYGKAMAGYNSFESMQAMPPPPPMGAMENMGQTMPQETPTPLGEEQTPQML